MFLNTLGISETVVYNIGKKLIIFPVIKSDRRGTSIT
jgi:hypothetical protein